MRLLLTHPQAQAAYAAMCALNNISYAKGIKLSFVGDCHTDDGEGDISRFDVIELIDGRIYVCCGPSLQLERKEFHDSQAAFAQAYGLN